MIVPLLTVSADGCADRSSHDQISFGRSLDVDLKLDAREADLSLSRLTGAFRAVEGRWFLLNVSDRAHFEVLLEGGTQADLRPGAAEFALLASTVGELRIQTVRKYSIRFDVEGQSAPMTLPDLGGEEATTRGAREVLQLDGPERRLLVALAEPRLLNPDAGAWMVPSIAGLEVRLGMSSSRIERITSDVAKKMLPYIDDIHGSNERRATARRHRMVDFAIKSGCVDRTDLRALDSPD